MSAEKFTLHVSNLSLEIATSVTSRPNTTERRRDLVQNYLLIWVDGTIDVENEDCQNTLTQLKKLVKKVDYCSTPTECIKLLNEMNDEKAFVISSGWLGQYLMTEIHDMAQVRAIYILCGNKTRHEEWAKKWPKIQGVFTAIKPICESLKQVTRDCDRDTIPISFVPKQKIAEDTLDQLPPSFMYSTLFKEIILDIDEDDNKSINDLVVYCQQKKIPEHELEYFKAKYHEKTPIWWYSCENFLYPMLNRALRTLDMEIMTKLIFFIRSLHFQLQELYEEQSNIYNEKFVVYRGQGLSQEDFQHLNNTKGGLLSFNNFLSTSTKLEIAMGFLNRSLNGCPENVGILFTMTIYPKKTSSKSISTPFAFVDDYSAMVGKENEILFSMHTIFRVESIEQMPTNARVWEVQLTLACDDDPQLTSLTKFVKQDIRGPTGWYRLGDLMIRAGDFDQAAELYSKLLKKASIDHERAYIYFELGRVKVHQGQYKEAIAFYEQSLEIYRRTLREDDPSLYAAYNNIAHIYNNMSEYSKALEYYEKSYRSRGKVLPPNHPDLATLYNNIGRVYQDMGEYSKALEYYEKSYKIYEQALPPNHPSLALSYNNIGQMYKDMGESSKALEYYKKSFKIRGKVLPSNHPNLAASYSNIAGMYNDASEYSKALEYYEKSYEIYEKALPPNHPDLAIFYNNIGRVYQDMGEYSKALKYYENSNKICEKVLSPNHPNLAVSYSSIGQVYQDMGEYWKALKCYEKSYKIREKALPPNHPDMAISHLNLASCYEKMGDYAGALRSLQNAFQIQEKTFEENDQAFSPIYSRSGRVYRSMKEYSKALDHFQKCLVIFQEMLPVKHPNFGKIYSDIGDIHRLMGDFEKALSFHQQALNIQEHVQCDPLDCATTYINIGETYYEMKDYTIALTYYQKGVKIRENKLGKIHPDLAAVYHKLAKLYLASGKYNIAMKFVEQALEIAQEKLPENHPHLVDYRQTLENIQKKS